MTELGDPPVLLAGLIGDPVEHSLSPFMHNAAFQALGIDARYELWPTTLAALGERAGDLRERGRLGANVTVPHKQEVMPHLDEISEQARRIGAVNTIIPRDGRLRGDNTDAYGFGRSLGEATGPNIPRCALVAGAGGAARAVLVSLQDAGVGDIVVINRTLRKAESLAVSLNDAKRTEIRVEPWASLPALCVSATLLVNATSIGWHGEELPFAAVAIAALPGEAVVMDLTYRSTALLREASARGLRTVDGLPMLIYQGARSFELWTGRTAPVEVMKRAVLAEQGRRS